MGILGFIGNIVKWALLIAVGVMVGGLLLLQVLFPREMELLFKLQAVDLIAAQVKAIGTKFPQAVTRLVIPGATSGDTAAVATRIIVVPLGWIVQGALVGLVGVWILLKTGTLDGLAKFSAGIAKDGGWGRNAILGAQAFPPLVLFGMIGMAAVSIVRFDIFGLIPNTVRPVFQMVDAWKELVTFGRVRSGYI